MLLGKKSETLTSSAQHSHSTFKISTCHYGHRQWQGETINCVEEENLNKMPKFSWMRHKQLVVAHWDNKHAISQHNEEVKIKLIGLLHFGSALLYYRTLFTFSGWDGLPWITVILSFSARDIAWGRCRSWWDLHPRGSQSISGGHWGEEGGAGDGGGGGDRGGAPGAGHQEAGARWDDTARLQRRVNSATLANTLMTSQLSVLMCSKLVEAFWFKLRIIKTRRDGNKKHFIVN